MDASIGAEYNAQAPRRPASASNSSCSGSYSAAPGIFERPPTPYCGRAGPSCDERNPSRIPVIITFGCPFQELVGTLRGFDDYVNMVLDHRDLHSFPTRRSSDLPPRIVVVVCSLPTFLSRLFLAVVAVASVVARWLPASRCCALVLGRARAGGCVSCCPNMID